MKDMFFVNEDTQMINYEETFTGQCMIGMKIYRKVITGITLGVGLNKIKHGIDNVYFPIKIYGTVTLRNGSREIFPESCCDNIVEYGISIRDFTDEEFGILLGTGYIDSSTPIAGGAHVIIEYTKK